MQVVLDARVRFHFVVADIALGLRRYEAAADAYARFLRLEPSRPDIEFHRAWCLVQVPRRREEGIAAFQRLLETSPSASGFYLMAIALHQEGRYDQAVAAFQEAGRLGNSAAADFHMNLGSSLCALGRWTEAGEAFGTAAHLNPQDAEAWTSLGEALMESGRWRDAVHCHERAMRLAPSGTYTTNLITTLVELDRLEEAERLLRDALARNPRAPVIKELLAQVLFQQERHQDALELAQEVRGANPGSLSARITITGVLSELGRADEAIAEAEAVVALEPENPMGHYALGVVRLNMKDGAAALVAFDRMAKCLERRDDKSIVTRNYYLAGRGLALSLLGDQHGARGTSNEVVRSDPTFFERHPEMAPQSALASRAEQPES